jgi:hypothetical protein
MVSLLILQRAQEEAHKGSLPEPYAAGVDAEVFINETNATIPAQIAATHMPYGAGMNAKETGIPTNPANTWKNPCSFGDIRIFR